MKASRAPVDFLEHQGDENELLSASSKENLDGQGFTNLRNSAVTFNDNKNKARDDDCQH